MSTRSLRPLAIFSTAVTSVVEVAVDHRHVRARGEQPLHRRQADAARRPRHERHAPRERRRRRRLELRLLEAPVLHVEEVPARDRRVGPDLGGASSSRRSCARRRRAPRPPRAPSPPIEHAPKPGRSTMRGHGSSLVFFTFFVRHISSKYASYLRAYSWMLASSCSPSLSASRVRRALARGAPWAWCEGRGRAWRIPSRRARPRRGARGRRGSPASRASGRWGRARSRRPRASRAHRAAAAGSSSPPPRRASRPSRATVPLRSAA